MLNAISVDVEEYFHVEAFAGVISPDSWASYESRIERNTNDILELFLKYNTKATFYILGCVAERYPALIKMIAAVGHEIGCHGFWHRPIYRQTPDQFRLDIRKARNILMEIINAPIVSYRAPSFSVTQATLWALDIMVEEGFHIDSSIFPIRHDIYGIPNGKRFPYQQITPANKQITEFPPSTIRLGKNNLGVAGGGYLRLLPYNFTRWAIRHINNVENQPIMVYFHPWEIDPEQPRIPASWKSKVRHYTNLNKMRGKIEKLLNDFQFDTVSSSCSQNHS
jgi:polysaccharide deacetylase family protein (PEP-CTERM system associated)